MSLQIAWCGNGQETSYELYDCEHHLYNDWPNFVCTNLRNSLGDLIHTIDSSIYQVGSQGQPIGSDYYLKFLEEEPANGMSDWMGNTDRNPPDGSCQSTNSFACGFTGGADGNDPSGITSLTAIFCHKKNWGQQCTQIINDAGYQDNDTEMCPEGQYIDSIAVQFDRDKAEGWNIENNVGINKLKFKCSTPQKADPNDPFNTEKHADRTGFFEIFARHGDCGTCMWHSVKTLQNAYFSGFAVRTAKVINMFEDEITGLLVEDIFGHEDDNGIVNIIGIISEYFDCSNSFQLGENIQNQIFNINPVNTDFEKPPRPTAQTVAYNQTTTWQGNDPLKNGIENENGIHFDEFLRNNDTKFCPLDECKLLKNCDNSQVLYPSSSPTDIWLDYYDMKFDLSEYNYGNVGDAQASAKLQEVDQAYGTSYLYYVNRDAEQIFGPLTVCIKCYNKDRFGNREEVTLNTASGDGLFTIELQCPDNLTISYPQKHKDYGTTNDYIDGFQDTQVKTLTDPNDPNADPIYPSNKPYFSFLSFYTQSKACPIMINYASDDENDFQKVPAGLMFTDPYYPIQSNPYTEDAVTGTVSDKEHRIYVVDDKKPAEYRFKIQVWALQQRSSLITTWLNLTVQCPPKLDVASPGFVTSRYTHLGAIGQDARYQFSEFVSGLPLCQQVIGYSIINVNPAGKLTYPSFFCTQVPCLEIDIDVSQVDVIKFNIMVQTSELTQSNQYSFTSAEVTITITQTAVSPQLVDPSNQLSQQIQISSGKYIIFDPYTCSTGCPVLHSLIFHDSFDASIINSNNWIQSPIETDVQSGKMKFQVKHDVLGQVRFYLRAELQSMPSINNNYGLFTIDIVCGSELVTVDTSLQTKFVYPNGPQIFYSLELSDYFNSNETQCPIITYQIEPPYDSSILNIPSGTSIIQFSPHAGYKIQIEVKAKTQSNQFATQVLDFILCGNENIQIIPLSNSESNYLLHNFDTSFNIPQNVFKYWFSTSYTSIDSDQECIELTYSLSQDAGCDYDNTLFQLTSSELKVISDMPFPQKNVCLQAITKGGEIAIQQLTFERGGFEVINLLNETSGLTISSSEFVLSRGPLYFKEGNSNLDLSQYNLKLESNDSKFPVSIFELLNKDLSLYQGHEVILTNMLGQFNLEFNRDQPLSIELVVRASSIDTRSPYLLNVAIKVCGFEIIQIGPYITKFYQITPSNNQIRQSEYETSFTSSNSECPMVEYQIFYGQDGKSLDQFPTIGNFKLGEAISMQVNAATNEHIIHVKNENIEDLKSVSKEYNFIDVNNNDMAITLQIRGITAGNVTANVSLILAFVSADSSLKINFQPSFEAQLPIININALDEYMQHDGKTFEQEFPKIKDIESNMIILELIDKPDFGIFECYYNDVIIQERVAYTYIDKCFYKVNLTTLVKEDQGKYSFEIKLYDDQSPLSPNRYSVQFQINWIETESISTSSTLRLNFLTKASCAPVKDLEFLGTDCSLCFENITYRICDEIIRNVIEWDDLVDDGQPINTYLMYANGKKLQNLIFSIRWYFTEEDGYKAAKCAFFNFRARPWIDKTYHHRKSDGYCYWERGRESKQSFALNSEQAIDQVFGYIDLREQLFNLTDQFVKAKDYNAPYVQEISFWQGTPKVFERSQVKPATLTIKFDQQLDIPKNFAQDLNETILEIRIHSAYDGFDRRVFYSSKANDIIVPFEESNFYKQEYGLLDPSEIIDQELFEEYKQHYDEMAFSWRLKTMDKQQMVIELNFINRIYISNDGKDKLIVGILPNLLFKGLYSLQYMNETSVKESYQEFAIQPMEKLRNDDTYETIVFTTQMALTAASMNKFLTLILSLKQDAGGILKSKGGQDLWGALNAQQIIIHLAIINMLMSSSTRNFFEFLCQLTQMDQWPTDSIYGSLFNLTETQPFREQFEIIGYENSNFLLLIGSIPINLTICLFSWIFNRAIIKLAVHYHKNDLIRKLASKYLVKVDYFAVVFRIYLEGFMEISILCLIAIVSYFSEVNETLTSKGDMFSKVLTFIFVAILISQYFLMAFIIIKNRKNIQDIDFKEKYGIIITDLSTQSIFSAIYHVAFMTRRGIIALILIFLVNYPMIQLMTLQVISHINIAYILKVKPFTDSKHNKNEVVNDIFIIQISQTLILFCINFPIDVEFKQRVGIYCNILLAGNLAFNFRGMASQIFFQLIPSQYLKINKLYVETKYAMQKYQWFKNKKDLAEKYPMNNRLQDDFQESILIKENLQSRKDFILNYDQIQQEISWLKLNNLSCDFLYARIESLREQFRQEQKKRDQNKNRWKHKVLGIYDLMQVPQPDLRRDLPHQVDGIDHERHERIVNKFLQETSLQEATEEQKKTLREKINHHKSYQFKKYLMSQDFRIINVSGQDQVPKILAALFLNSLDAHQKVKKSIFDFAILKKQEDLKGEKTAIKKMLIESYRADISHYVKKGSSFCDEQIALAAQFFNVPIIVLCQKFDTHFYDKLFNCDFEDSRSKNQLPIYLLDDGDGNMSLLFKSEQTEIKDKFQRNKNIQISKLKKVKKDEIVKPSRKQIDPFQVQQQSFFKVENQQKDNSKQNKQSDKNLQQPINDIKKPKTYQRKQLSKVDEWPEIFSGNTSEKQLDEFQIRQEIDAKVKAFDEKIKQFNERQNCKKTLPSQTQYMQQKIDQIVNQNRIRIAPKESLQSSSRDGQNKFTNQTDPLRALRALGKRDTSNLHRKIFL